MEVKRKVDGKPAKKMEEVAPRARENQSATLS